jgi:hypothetical protein
MMILAFAGRLHEVFGAQGHDSARQQPEQDRFAISETAFERSFRLWLVSQLTFLPLTLR